MPGVPEPDGGAFERRRERWARESAELRDTSAAPGSSVEETLRRYQRSRTARVALPAPGVSRLRQAALERRRRRLLLQLTAALGLLPILLVLALVIDSTVATVALLALLVPTVGVAAHRARAIRRVDGERHVRLSGGLADAWGDWVRAREELAALSGASQAQAALAANELRMEVLVLALADSDPARRDTEEQRASRAWVYENAAKAVALAAAEGELDAVTRGRTAAAELHLAPEGDADALDRALETARELRRTDDDPGR